MYIEIFVIALLAGMSPGPDFFLVMKNSLGNGRKSGVASSLGIATALAIHASYTILGIALIIRHHHMLYMIIQMSGAVYLAYLGTKTILSTFGNVKREFTEAGKIEIPASLREGFVNGFLCNMLNPKAFVFFLSIFSQFISPGMTRWMELVYGAEVVITIGLWFVALSVLVSSKRFRTIYKMTDKWLERVFGAILVFFAVRVYRSALE